MATRRKSDLPFGSQLSPAQIDLGQILELLGTHGAADDAFTEAVRKEYFHGHAHGDEEQQREIAKNVRLSLREYGIVGLDDKPTELGFDMIRARGDAARLGIMARQILLNLKGLELLLAVSDMKTARTRTTLVDIARELESRGIHVPESGTHISSMKGWLAKAGVVNDQWDVDDDRLRQLIGHGMSEVDEMSRFTPEQRAFIRALVAMPGDGPLNSAEVARHATTMSHVMYDPKNLREQVIFPLRDQGYLEVTKTTSGRGAKPYVVRATSKFDKEFVVPILEALAHSLDVAPEILRKPLDEIVTELSSPNKNVKGRALEMLAANLCRIIGLQITGWRLRSKESGGQEVDVVAEGTNYVFLRWELQCKNTRAVSADDIAREVGVAVSNSAGVVLILTTGRFSEPAKKYAERIAKTTTLNVVLLDGKDLREIVRHPARTGQVLGRHARKTMRLKRLEGLR